MRLFSILISWLFLLGFGFVICKAMTEKTEPLKPWTKELYWSKEKVRNVCLGKDSCTIGKFTHFSIPDFAG